MKSKLAAMRKQKGYSQNDLAVASGVPVKTIQWFELYPEKIDGTKLNTLCSLSLALNCKIEDIIEGKELIEKFKRVRC